LKTRKQNSERTDLKNKNKQNKASSHHIKFSINKMNTNNISNNSVVYYTLDELLTSNGSTWYLDYFNMYLVTIVSILGFLLNLFSLVIFLDKEFQTDLYVLLLLYVLVRTCTQ
jgi:hypothetical protein